LLAFERTSPYHLVSYFLLDIVMNNFLFTISRHHMSH